MFHKALPSQNEGETDSLSFEGVAMSITVILIRWQEV